MCAMRSTWNGFTHSHFLENLINKSYYYSEGNAIFITNPSYCTVHLFDCMKKGAPEMYKCEKCNFKGFLKVNLKIHMELFHKSADSHFTVENFCTVADTNYNMTNILKYHSCLKCDFSTYSLLLYGKHLFQKHKESVLRMIRKPKPKPQKKPTKQQKEPTKLQRRSKYRIFDEGTNLFECDQCDMKTKTAYALMKHIKSTHGCKIDDVIIFSCKHCSFKTQNAPAFNIHVNRHIADGNGEWLVCTQCSYKTKHRHYLNRHVRANHTASENIKWVQCQHCPYKAKYKQVLKDHIVAKHTPPEDINWFLCEFCAFKCKHKRNLVQHLRGKHKIQV